VRPFFTLFSSSHNQVYPVEKSPLSPLCQRGAHFLPLVKGGEEGFYNQCLHTYDRISNPINHALPYLSEENSLRYRKINFFTTSALFRIIWDKKKDM
jgi:hypothetical protein